MIALDMRTVAVANVILSCLFLVILTQLYLQNAKKYPGLAYWVLYGGLQLGSSVLFALRGIIPPWASIVLANGMYIGSYMALTLGLYVFIGKGVVRLISIYAICFPIFLIVHGYFTIIQNDLHIRLYNTAISLILISSLGSWTMIRGCNPECRHIYRGTGISLMLYSLVHLSRVLAICLQPVTTNDFMKSNSVDTFLVTLMVGVNVVLVLSLIMMVNKCLIIETTQSESRLRDNQALLLAQFRNSPDVIMVLDREYRILSLNKIIFSDYRVEDLIGKNAFDMLPKEVHPRVEAEITACFETNTVRVFEHKAVNGKWALTRIIPLPDDKIMVIATDISEKKEKDTEREHLIIELSESLEKVKTLSGLLPICSYCNKIRDDQGYWEEVSAYITSHSNAKFSHGICPQCFDREKNEIKKYAVRRQADEQPAS